MAAFRFALNIRHGRRTLTFSGVAALIIMLGLLVLPHLFAASLDATRAEKEIRAHLMSVAASRDAADQLDRLLRSEFVSVKIRRSLLTPPFSSERVFVAKAVIRDPDGVEQTRYFALSSESKFFDHFWVAEHSRLTWILSI